MANIWTDTRVLNNENGQYQMKSKQTPVSGNNLIKKQVFGEIKNVLHNKIGATPLKGNAAKIDGLSSAFSSSKSLCTEVLRKQQMNKNFADSQNKLERKQQFLKFEEDYKEPVFDEGLFDSWDIDRGCCRLQKTDEEMWSDMRALDLNIGDLNFELSSDHNAKEDFLKDPPIVPELDDLPNILDDMNLMCEDNTTGFDYESVHLPDLDYFDPPF